MSTFNDLDIKAFVFEECNLLGAQFVNVDFEGGVFDQCDLRDVYFFNTNLKKADFYSSYGYDLVLENNQVDRAIFD